MPRCIDRGFFVNHDVVIVRAEPVDKFRGNLVELRFRRLGNDGGSLRHGVRNVLDPTRNNKCAQGDMRDISLHGRGRQVSSGLLVWRAEASVQKKFSIALRTEDRRVSGVDLRHAKFLKLRSYLFYGLQLRVGIAHDAALSNLVPPDLELWLYENDEFGCASAGEHARD